MYFSGTISIDPAQLTNMVIVPPTRIFAKFLNSVTGGRTTEHEEQETFTAVSILQQFNRVLRDMGITNLVRLAKDDYDFYFDKDGKDDDLKEVFADFAAETLEVDPEVFEHLYLVLEHEDDLLKYLIEVDIRRRHKPSEAPIEITINGMMKGMEPADDSAEAMQETLASVFDSQDAYNAHIRLRRTRFDAFLNEFEEKLRRFIEVDQLGLDKGTRIITPVSRVESTADIRYFRHVEPVYFGYHGFTDAWFYAWVWSSMAHAHGIQIQDCDLVNESGMRYHSVDAAGINAGEDRLFSARQFSDTSAPDRGPWASIESDGESLSFLGALFSGDGCGSGCGGGCGGCGGGA